MATQVSLTDGAVASAGALAIQTNGTTQAVSISTGQVATLAQNPILTSGTANGVAYLNGSKAVTSGSALVFDGTNLGVGVTPSAWGGSFKAIQIGLGTSLYNNAGANGTFLGSNFYWDGTNNKYLNTNTATAYGQSAGAHQWFTAASGTAGANITFTQAMTLDASGNLLVGTTTLPSNRKFIFEASGDTVGRINSGGASSGLSLEFANNGTLRGGIGNGAGNITSGAAADMAIQANANLVFASGGYGEKARIDSSGNLLVGTTNSNENAGAGFKLLTSGQVACVTTANTTNAQLTTYELYSTGAGAFRFYVGAGGTIFATSTTISAISDIRFKENVRDLDAGLAEVMALKPRLYDWKEGKGADIKNARGFIAQEFEEVFPDLIDEWRDPAPEGEERYKSVRQDLIPVLVKAIQEQQALITKLQADVAALKGA
jgi:hypothetical protein